MPPSETARISQSSVAIAVGVQSACTSSKASVIAAQTIAAEPSCTALAGTSAAPLQKRL